VSGRRDADAPVEAGRTPVARIGAVRACRNAIVRDTLGELHMVAKMMRHIGARESLARLDGLALALAALSIHSVRELVVLASPKQRS
jgi:hypothetical protein